MLRHVPDARKRAPPLCNAFCQSETDVKIALGVVTAFWRSAVGLSAVRLLDHAVDVDRAENRSGALISEDNHTITPW